MVGQSTLDERVKHIVWWGICRGLKCCIVLGHRRFQGILGRKFRSQDQYRHSRHRLLLVGEYWYSRVDCRCCQQRHSRMWSIVRCQTSSSILWGWSGEGSRRRMMERRWLRCRSTSPATEISRQFPSFKPKECEWARRRRSAHRLDIRITCTRLKRGHIISGNLESAVVSLGDERKYVWDYAKPDSKTHNQTSLTREDPGYWW